MEVDVASGRCREILDAIAETVVADEGVLEGIVAGYVAGGHVLLEDVPGTGKTLTARTVAAALGLSFSRIQFTPDLLPADITGTYVFDEREREFEFQPGGIFANVVLADEINRASPKTQAALLEAMEEGQVTVEGETHALPDPFFVIATQNPVEHQGTFELPAAQKDRFVVKTSLGYPDAVGEREILDRRADRRNRAATVDPVCSPDEAAELQATTEAVRVEPIVRDYVVSLARATREEGRVEWGASPRATERLFEAARAMALIRGRDYVTPDDVKAVAPSVFAHRLVLTADARVTDLTGREVVEDVLSDTPVPTVTPSPAG